MHLKFCTAGVIGLLTIGGFADAAHAEDRGWAQKGGGATVSTVSPNGTAKAATPARSTAPDTFQRNMAWIDSLTGVTSAPSAGGTTAAPGGFSLEPQAASVETRAPRPPAAPFSLQATPSSGVGIANTPDTVTAAIAPEPAPAPAAAEKIDLTALKYYAAQNNIAHVAAEIRRLQAQHPGWVPPQTLFNETVTVDEQPMWDLYGEGKLDALYARIREEKGRTPGYVPSAVLVAKLKQAEGRRAIETYAEAKDFSRVLAVAQAMPDLLVCAEMQTLWNVAEAFAQGGSPQRALDLYVYILSNCNDPNERFATVQKAAGLLPDPALDGLMQLGQTKLDGQSEFDAIRLDQLRGKVGRAIEERFGEKPTEEELQRLASAATMERNVDDAMLLGWYHHAAGAHEEATAWFDRALQMSFSVKALEGYILSLREGGQSTEARDVALEYNGEDEAIAKLFIEIAASDLTDDDPRPVGAEALEVIEAVTESHKSALGAQSLGWYLFNQSAEDEAMHWFEKSVEWEPTAEGVLGLAIARNKAGDRNGVKELAELHGEEFPTLEAFVEKIGPDPKPRRVARASGGGQKVARRSGGGKRKARRSGGGGDRMMREALQAYEAGNYDAAIAKLDARKAVRGETSDVTTLRGWALHNSGKHKRAYKVFTELNKGGGTKETRAGARHSWRRMMPSRYH